MLSGRKRMSFAQICHGEISTDFSAEQVEKS